MKNLIILLLALSTQAFAQQQSTFDHSVECENGRNGRTSRISQVENLGSVEGVTSFRMILSYGRCDSIDEIQGAIKIQKRMLQINRYGLNYPFQKDLAWVESFRALSETELEAIISLDESSLRKRDSRRFTFRFWAQDWIGFPWVMTFKKSGEEINVDFRGFEEI